MTEIDIRCQVMAAAVELVEFAKLSAGHILVVGCSTSEVQGVRIGCGGSAEVAQTILSALREICTAKGIALAIQCCEHLNRALVVERSLLQRCALEQVTVIPVPQAGGALAAQAMQDFEDPVVVEHIQADAGLDIGNTLIGMQLKHVAVPLRLAQKQIGQAMLVAAYTRPKLIGGVRAIYTKA